MVCGSLHLDLLVYAPHLPRSDETAVGTGWGTVCGGKGGNQAEMASRLGARTAMIGRIGSDEFGRQLQANLDINNVDRQAVSVDPSRGSGMSVAIEQPDGSYGAVIVSGANLGLEPTACCRALQAGGDCKVLILQNEIPPSVNGAMAAAASAQGVHVILNAAPARAVEAALYDSVDTLVVNRIEAAMIAGLPVEDLAAAKAALPLLGGGRRNVVITLGGDGLVVQPRDGAAVSLAAHRVTAVSTHGAGDCFVGAVASRLSRGETLIEAVTYANLAAATLVSLSRENRKAFGQSSLPH